MPLVLQKATPADLLASVPAQYAAFHTVDPLHMLIYPSPIHPTPEVIQKTIARQETTWSDPHVEWVKIVDDQTGDFIAAAKWIFHDDSDEARWEQQIEPVWIEGQAKGNAGPGVEDYEYVKWAVEEMNWRRRERFRGPGAMLDLLFVAPAHHRRGAGKLLVQWGTKQADEKGWNTYVESSAAGKKLYENCGFVVEEDVMLKGGKERKEWTAYGEIPYLWLKREPQGQKP
ncbi:hypothetical protein B0O99DRAFT_627468 [Bisporella sp. PMI_857]|nr:hypothetical protein B0O99DRAFT_627468 [Bisporella sp. PMI_857]